MPGQYTLALDAAAIIRLNTMAAAARPFEAPAWARAGIVEGATVLDVGCGPGAFLGEFASIIGPSGRAVGLDSSPETVDVCAAYLAHHDLTQASVKLADAFDSHLEPASFDVAHARLLLIHLGHRAAELLAIVRELVRPGGHLVLTDVDGPSCGLSETIPAFQGAMTVIPPGIEFRLPHWEARDAIIADQIATEQDVLRWEPAITRFMAERTAYFTMPMYTLVGRRPVTGM